MIHYVASYVLSYAHIVIKLYKKRLSVSNPISLEEEYSLSKLIKEFTNETWHNDEYGTFYLASRYLSVFTRCSKSPGYRFCDLVEIHSVLTTLRIFAQSGMRHINKVESISRAERKRGRMESAREARSRGGSGCRAFHPFFGPCARHPARFLRA